MIYNVKIYQMEDGDNLFMPYDFTMKHGGIKLNDYKMIYEMNMVNHRGIYDSLNMIYDRFNLYHPEDYRGRSLSVSDIVELNGDKYYVDSLGFKLI